MAEQKMAPWNMPEEIDWLDYSIQPPAGLLKGEYYYTEREFGGTPWASGHMGRLEVVKDDTGRLIFVEFNERTMDTYYYHYFSGRDKRRSDYGMWQASKERQAKLGWVLVNGMQHVESQILERQSLRGEFDLLTGASGSMKNMVPMAKQLADIIDQPSGKRFYSLSENFGYGLTGWLRVVVQGERLLSCQYDEVFADHQDEIWYPELKRYYKQSKYHSPCFEEPFPPGWNLHAWLIGFRNAADMLQERVIQRQNLLDIEGLPHTDGENLGPVWDRRDLWDRPITYVKGAPRPRYPIWDNYLRLATALREELRRDGVCE